MNNIFLQSIKYLILLIDDNAASFCYYKNPSTNNSKENLMSYNNLKSILNYAEDNGLFLNILYNKDNLPKKHADLINKSSHISFIPLEHYENDLDNILIINPQNDQIIDGLENNNTKNIILRLEKNDLNKLFEIFNSLLGKFKRLNLILLDIEKYKENDFNIYREELNKINSMIKKEYINGNAIEFNIISDRILLNNMQNCNAGIDHITIAPNGKFYICPAFYYDDVDNPVGDMNSGINIKNNQLLELNYSPICKICDAFHCKRCVWLNKKTTLEINTPSHQQCVLSHIEREASRILLSDLHSNLNFNDFNNIASIPEIDYNDPITGSYKIVQGNY